MRKAKFLLQGRPLFWAFVGGLIVFSGVVLNLASFVDIDFFDAHKFLLQAKRLWDPNYSFVPLDADRPPAFVLFLSLVDRLYYLISGAEATLQTFHSFIAVVTIGFIVVWVLVGKKLFGARVGYLLGILLFSHQLILHYSIFLISDIWSGFFWGMCLFCYLCFLEQCHLGYSWRRIAYAFLAGVFGGIVAMSKNHLLLLLPGTVGVCLALNWLFLKKNIKAIWWGSVLSFLVFFGTADLLARAVGGMNRGLITHVLHALGQARGLEQFAITPRLYAEGYFRMFGWGFWVLVIGLGTWLGVYLLRKQSWKRVAFSDWKWLGVGALVVVNFLGALFLQLLIHRETRYMIPHVPAILLPAALIIAYGYEQVKRYRWLYSFVCVAVLVPAWARTFQDARVYYTDRIYQSNRSQLPEYWEYLRSQKHSPVPCREIRTCFFALLPQTPFELAQDPYYRRYDIYPQYEYFARVPATWSKCWEGSGKLSDLVKQLEDPPQKEKCYVLRRARSEFENEDFVTVFQVIGMDLLETEANRIEQQTQLAKHQELTCEKKENKRYNCFVHRNFFQ